MSDTPVAPLYKPRAEEQQLQFDFKARCPERALQEYEPLLNISEASALFNLKPHVLRRAVKIGAIPMYRLANRRIRLRASDINAAIQKTINGGVK